MKTGLLNLALLCLAGFAFSNCTSSEDHPEDKPVVSGVLDLRPANTPGRIALKGDWSFAKDYLGVSRPMALLPYKVPQQWTFADWPEKRFGYGTYFLTILAPLDSPDLALKIPTIGSSYTVYWNGVRIAQAGQPETSAKTWQPGWRPQVVFLTRVQPKNQLVIQVANFQDITAGMGEAPVIGDAQTLVLERQIAIMFDVMIFGGLLLMGFYHFGLYFYRSKDPSPVWFAFLALDLGIRPLFYGEMVLLDVYPGLGFDLFLRLGYLTFSLAVPLFISFLNSLYPGPWLKQVNRLAWVVSVVYSLVILFTPALNFNYFLPWFQIFTMLVGLFSLGVIVGAVVQKKNGSILFTLGFLVFFAATSFDILMSILRVQMLQIVPAGLLVFMLFQSLIIAKRFSLAFSASEEFSRHLSHLNNSLERFIPKEVLSFLQKDSIVDIGLGDHTQRIMTVFFADIRNFTTMSEAMTPDENFRFINSYLKRVGPYIRQHGGFVDKYMGDGIMALFPRTADDALRAALGIRQELDTYNQQRLKVGYEPIRIGMGIHTGHLMMGTIGENLRMDSTVISDTVNVAARLESLTKKLETDILVSKDTLGYLETPEQFELEEVGEETVKGKALPIHVFKLKGASPA